MKNTNTTFFSIQQSNTPFQEDQEIGDVCIANISPRERQIRLRVAKWQLAIALVLLLAMIALQLDPIWRFLLFFIFSASGVGYFQARDKT